MFNKVNKESIHTKLKRVRAPRVHITYDVFTHGAVQEIELPFVVGILSQLSGNVNQQTPTLKERKFIQIDRDNFNSVLKSMKPCLEFDVINKLSGESQRIPVKIHFECIDDFNPGNFAFQIEPLRDLLEERSMLTGKIYTDATVNEKIGDQYNTFLKRINEIDLLLSAQLNEILHLRPFQQLEASWRGLYFLVCQTETSAALKLRVLDATKMELFKDLQTSVEFDQSALFKKLYEEEYGTFGGQPYGLLVGDYEFGHEPSDLFLLEEFSHIGAAMLAPFIGSAGPSLFGLESFSDLTNPPDLSNIFINVDYAKWRTFRESSDARYVGLALPHILLRRPYNNFCPVEQFDFQEQTEKHEDFLWGNAAYALGSCITNAFAKYGWCAAIRGVEGGGLVEGLPWTTVKSDEGMLTTKCPTELPITDRREIELAYLGFIPLSHMKDTDFAAFFSMQTCCKPKVYDGEAANANARLSTQLQYVLTTSRFAQYLKCIVRDRVGSFYSRGDLEKLLNQWINKYVSVGDISTQEKAEFPLREARVEVTEMPGKPAVYKAVVFLRPHFQLDELSISMRLVVELPPVH